MPARSDCPYHDALFLVFCTVLRLQWVKHVFEFSGYVLVLILGHIIDFLYGTISYTSLPVHAFFYVNFIGRMAEWLQTAPFTEKPCDLILDMRKSNVYIIGCHIAAS